MAKFVLSELSDQHDLIKKIKELLTKATKQQVAFVAVNKLVKKAGVATKTVDITMEEGHVISLVFRTDGDVIQHKLNNKVIPLSKVMDYDKMADFEAGLEDLALKLKANHEKFNIKRQTARVVIPRKREPSLTVKKRIEQARQALKEHAEIIAQRRQHLEQKKSELEALELNLGAGA